jgi:hypothetical protein
MDYYGPEEWRREAQAEELPPAGRLVDDAEHLLDTLPYAGARGEYVGAQLHALRALVGPSLPLPELVRDCLGLRVAPLPESVFERAHAQLDRSLPGGSGSLAQRLHDWTRRHELPLEHLSRLPAMVDRAVTETRARTRAAIVTLPADEVVDCEVVPGAPFLAAGWHRGGTRSTILVTGDRPFNLADLLYVVAHEGHPGHIAEQVLKEIHLVRRQGRAEQLLRFLPSPPHVLSEGLGLHAQSLIFPGGQAQDWLTGTVLGEAGIEPDGSDFAGIHGARDVLFGVRANAALLAAEGRPEAEVAAYLRRWALLDDQQTRTAVRALTVPGGNPYIFAYYYGRELVGAWLAAGPNPAARVRRLLTEQLLPADLATP